MMVDGCLHNSAHHQTLEQQLSPPLKILEQQVSHQQMSEPTSRMSTSVSVETSVEILLAAISQKIDLG
eukprot:CAMPEP_0178567580 /NCGR_PEP_ID=MMETSP0697-20121206/15409_1 /TAXON_ID=265572 /ORGANISM="Extubocellulus spinifer, Strain CCMP396" /LENGTH=67 /DNA_ID=CAMNT_0020201539 /DNA_START=217 /DNA_END=416 /DNA_ORIENTATION=+